MSRGGGGAPGSSLSNPIIFTSSQSLHPSSQVDQLLSSQASQHSVAPQSTSRAHPLPPPQLSHLADSGAVAGAGLARFRWSSTNEYDFVKAIKDNVHYQAALLLGHSRKVDDDDAPPSSGKLTNVSLLRAISTAIFKADAQLSPNQMRQKLTGLIDTYRKVLKTESSTGKGLLMSEMHDNSTTKSLRESILERYPWYELMHQMMIDRAASDPKVVVNNAGEHRLVSSFHTKDDQEPIDIDNSDDGGDDGDDRGRSPFSQARQHGLYDDELDLDDDDDESSTLDPRLRRSSGTPDISRPSASDGRRSSGILIPGRGSSTLPTLGDLAARSSIDRQRSGAVSSSQRQSSSAIDRDREGSPARSTAASSSRAASSLRIKTEAIGQSKGSKGKARPSQAEILADRFTRTIDEDRHLRLEREETKRRRLDLQIQAREGERQSDLINTQISSIPARIDSVQISVNARMDGVSGMMSGLL
ncbi:hypothetical protein V8E36_002675 [Tilletia maclaganii]